MLISLKYAYIDPDDQYKLTEQTRKLGKLGLL